MLRVNQRAQIPDYTRGVISPKSWGQFEQTPGVNSFAKWVGQLPQIGGVNLAQIGH